MDPREVQKTIDEAKQNLSELKLKHWMKLIEQELEKLNDKERILLATQLHLGTRTEISERQTEMVRRRVSMAKFIRMQTIDQYDFDYNASTKKIKIPLLKLNQAAKEGIVPKAVFVGNTGLGKTHLARSLGFTTCQAGNSVLFAKASTIVNSLATAKATHTLESEIKRYRKPQLLIIDEVRPELGKSFRR